MSALTDVLWIEVGPYPIKVGFTMSAKALRKEFKAIGDPIERGEELIGNANAIVWHTDKASPHYKLAICYLPKPKSASDVQVAGILAHEALHIVQFAWERMNEKVRCEAEAYLLQHIFQTMYSDYRKAMGIDK